MILEKFNLKNMNEQQIPNQKELLYSPKNWAFIAFFLSPILPAIFYYRNCKLLNTSSKGKKILIGTIFFVLVFLVAATIFSYYSTPIILTEAIIAVIIAKKLPKTQLGAYEKMKKEKGLKGGRNEAPLMLLFLVLMIGLTFVLPYILNKYIESKHIQHNYMDEIINRPR